MFSQVRRSFVGLSDIESYNIKYTTILIYPLPLLKVVAGDHDLFGEEGTEQRVKVQNVIIHPG